MKVLVEMQKCFFKVEIFCKSAQSKGVIDTFKIRLRRISFCFYQPVKGEGFSNNLYYFPSQNPCELYMVYRDKY